MISLALRASGRGALISRRRCAARHAGALSSENAGMSNHKESENLSHRKSKVSWAMTIIPGLVGPKPRRSSVGDGQRVNIPVPVYVCFWVRIEYVGAGSWLYPSKSLLWRRMKGLQRPIPTDTVTRKAQNAWHTPTVPQTDTGTQVE